MVREKEERERERGKFRTNERTEKGTTILLVNKGTQTKKKFGKSSKRHKVGGREDFVYTTGDERRVFGMGCVVGMGMRIDNLGGGRGERRFGISGILVG